MANLVNHTDKWGSIHIPKTGGTSLTQQLDDTPNTEIVTEKHESIRVFENIKDYFIFTIIRNPFYRFISSYEHFNRTIFTPVFRNNNWIDESKIINSKLDILYYIQLIEQNKYFMYNTQSFYINDGSSDDKKVSFIGRFEKYDTDLKFIFDKIKMDFDSKMRLNRNPKSSKYVPDYIVYNEYYKNKIIFDWVLDFYREDFENFGYDKKLLK